MSPTKRSLKKDEPIPSSEEVTRRLPKIKLENGEVVTSAVADALASASFSEEPTQRLPKIDASQHAVGEASAANAQASAGAAAAATVAAAAAAPEAAPEAADAHQKARPSVDKAKCAREAPDAKDETAAGAASAVAGAGKNSASAREAAGNRGASKPRGKRPIPRWARIAMVIAGVLVVIAAAIAAVFAWNEWLICDDAASIQGSWVLAEDADAFHAAINAADPTDESDVDGEAPNGALESAEALTEKSGVNVIAVDAHVIIITRDAAYEYTLDTRAKTVTFAFAGSEGAAHYRFSADRRQLGVIEGAPMGTASMLWGDFLWQVRDFWSWITRGSHISPTDGVPADGSSMVLVKVADWQQTGADDTGEAETMVIDRA